jgi:hypothetical protein
MTQSSLARAAFSVLALASAGAGCTDDPDGSSRHDAAPSARDAGADAAGELVRDAASDAALDASRNLDAAWSLCRVPSREACGIDDEDAGQGGCTGATPVRCLHQGEPLDASVASPACAASAELCRGYHLMTLTFECDDTRDCPVGQICISGQNPSFVTGSSCVPDCVDHYLSWVPSRGTWQACRQDCECGELSRCTEGGKCTTEHPYPYLPMP